MKSRCFENPSGHWMNLGVPVRALYYDTMWHHKAKKILCQLERTETRKIIRVAAHIMTGQFWSHPKTPSPYYLSSRLCVFAWESGYRCKTYIVLRWYAKQWPDRSPWPSRFRSYCYRNNDSNDTVILCPSLKDNQFFAPIAKSSSAYPSLDAPSVIQPDRVPGGKIIPWPAACGIRVSS